MHIKHIFEDKELEEDSVVRLFRTTAADGKKYEVAHYNSEHIRHIFEDEELTLEPTIRLCRTVQKEGDHTRQSVSPAGHRESSRGPVSGLKNENVGHSMPAGSANPRLGNRVLGQVKLEKF